MAWGRFQGAQRRVIGVACGAHILHDGYTDLLYVLLPLWQTEFALDYAGIRGGVFRFRPAPRAGDVRRSNGSPARQREIDPALGQAKTQEVF